MKVMLKNAVDIFNGLWQVEFWRGVILTLGAILAILIVYGILKLIFRRKFGRRRCSSIAVKCPTGSIVVAGDAISASLRAELKQFNELEIRRITIYRRKERYSVEMRGTLLRNNGDQGLPELHSKIEPMIRERLSNFFGIKELDDVALRIDRAGFFDEEYHQDSKSITPELPDFPVK